jgi:two-component system sensor histidine kinase VicK
MSKRKTLKLKISSKLLLFFLIVSLVPLFVATIVLVNSGKKLLLNAAVTRQQIVANDTANRVDSYLSSKVSALTLQSEIYSDSNLNESSADQNLAVLMKQDHDLEQVSLLNSSGQQQIVFNQQGEVHTLSNMSQSDAFKAVSYLKGQNFIGPVTYNSNNEPQITIAVPLLKTNLSQNLNDLPAASLNKYSSPSDFLGVLVANYNISDLWQSVLSIKIGHGGYAYVVDGLGNLVAHPNKQFLTTHQKLSSVPAVAQFINGDFSTRETTSEVGSKVISTPKELSLTNWAVIVEEPVSSVYSGINSFIKLSSIITFIAVVLSIAMSLVFRKQLLDPIKRLMFGAKKLEGGDFGYTVTINSNDELQELANTFNTMGLSIKKLIGDLETKNVNLVTEQTKLNNIIRSVSDGVIALNDKGEVLSINPPAAKLINKRPEDVRGKRIVDLFPWTVDDKPCVIELKKPGLYHYTDLALQQGKEVSYLDIMVSVIDSKDSDVTGIITIHDLTQSRELEFMKLDFVAIAAHELRTPLTVVQGYLSLLNTEALDQLSIFNIENLQKAILGTDQLRNLINKLLNMSRIERGEMELSIDKLDLSKLVNEVVSQHQPTAAQREQSIIYKSNTTKNVYVPGDVSSLTEVLNNLLGNALKFTDEGGTVKVNLDVNEANDEVRVEVIDNGPGVPTALRPRLFTKFYRAQRSLVAGNRGTGLGLFISKSIIELHHGKIGLEPYTGKGSTFYFTLPVYNEAKHAKLLSKDRESGGIRGWFKKRSTR